jgi:hypothetical protein
LTDLNWATHKLSKFQHVCHCADKITNGRFTHPNRPVKLIYTVKGYIFTHEFAGFKEQTNLKA